MARAHDVAKPAPASLGDLRRTIRRDFIRACEALYFINPRSKFDPETGEEMPVEPGAETGLIRFRLFPEQHRTASVMIAQQQNRQPVRVVKVKPRQSGDSTYGCVWQFHQVYWSQGEHGLLVAHHDKTTSNLYGKIQTLYAELPDELKIQPKKLNRQELAFEAPYNNSIIAQTAGYLDLGHGLTITHCHLSEIDLWPDAEVALEGLMETVAMAPGTSIYIESKAQGVHGFLYNFWKRSKEGKTGFTPLFTAWYQVPEYRWPVPVDFEPTTQEREWIAEYGITPAQIMWYRVKRNQMIAKEPWGGERRMLSSYPLTDDEAFQGSGMCVFPDIVLRRLHEGCRPPTTVLRLEQGAMPGEIHAVASDYHPDWPLLSIWKAPEEGRHYAIGVDVGDGVNQSESVVSVCAYPGYEQVAEWSSNKNSVEETVYVARYLAERYGGHHCVIVPEINRNGQLILTLLYNLPGTYSIFRWRYFNRPGMVANDNPVLGWETNGQTKPILVQIGNTVYLRGQGIIRSEILHEQMTRCIDIMPGRRWAAQGGRSDRIIAWMIACAAAFLDYEGASIGNIVSDRPKTVDAFEAGAWRDPGTYDAGVDEVFGAPARPTGTGYLAADLAR